MGILTLPNFIFLGPDKAGSSWLAKALAAHPDVYVTPAKDTYFFADEFHRGIEWYQSQFRPQHNESVIVEVCHDYLPSVDAPKRMVDILPDGFRVMVCLREPVDRAFSAYLNMAKAWDMPSFVDAVQSFPELVGNGMYGHLLGRLVEFIPQERIYIAFFDDLQSDPQRFFSGLCEWLGIADFRLSLVQLGAERAASRARSRWLASGVKAGAKWARQRGWATAVGRIKNASWVQMALYRQYGEARPEVPADVAAALRVKFGDDLRALDEQFGVDSRRRWGYSRG